MKKVLCLVLTILIFAPFVVNAEDNTTFEPFISDKPISNEDKGNNIVTKTYEVYVTISGEPMNFTDDDDGISLQLQFGKAITGFSCGEPSDKGFVASIDESNNVCSFKPTSSEAITGKVLLGTLSVDVDKTHPDEDCSINYALNGVKGKINPETGASLPTLYILGGVALAGIIFYSTKRKAKFSNL